MKKIIIVCGLIVGVTLAMMLIIFFLYSQVNYVNLVDKKVSISEDDSYVLIIDKENKVVFNYAIFEWRESAELLWPRYFKDLMVGDKKLSPEDFSKFTAASAFPEGTKTLAFATSFSGEEDVSLFWTLNIDTKEITPIGDVNFGAIGGIIWSPQDTHFAYLLNTKEIGGKYLTVDNVVTKKKEFTLTGDDILKALDRDSDDYHPEFRMMRWDEDGKRLNFTTNNLAKEGSIRWSIGVDGEELKMEIN